jgi:hypothetical protein
MPHDLAVTARSDDHVLIAVVVQVSRAYGMGADGRGSDGDSDREWAICRDGRGSIRLLGRYGSGDSDDNRISSGGGARGMGVDHVARQQQDKRSDPGKQG